MKKNILITLLLTLTIFVFAGCSTPKNNDQKEEVVKDNADNTDGMDDTSNVPEESPSTMEDEVIFDKINAKTAKEMMEASDKLIILDVRTPEEYEEGHVEGAILIPDYEIEARAEELLTDKTTTILVYCRSGRRSAIASQVLSDLGYQTIYDFGGIIDWPYDVVTE